MHVFIDERAPVGPVIRAPQWRRRRIRSHLRRVGRGFASRVAAGWISLIRALHESRRRSAARRIDRHRHLFAGAYRAHQAGLESHPSDPVQS
jgi:hypothetical protein